MKKTNSVLKHFTILALLLSCAALAFADGEKERMIERTLQIRNLKTAGVIGEKSNGLLGFVKESPANQAVVSAENKDRKTVYAEIARSQGVSTAAVAKRRAAKLGTQAASGDWLQNTDGKWVQKK